MQNFEFSKTFGWTPREIKELTIIERSTYIAILKGIMNANKSKG